MEDDHKDSVYITTQLCEAYRKILEERIEGLKKSIYLSALSITTVLAVVQVTLTLLR